MLENILKRTTKLYIIMLWGTHYMEKINSEILISPLFLIGFDRVDSLLFKYTLRKLSVDNIEKKSLYLKMKNLVEHLTSMLILMEVSIV